MKYQSGNALFLILIAVALFAALSYAITSSGRGGGNIDREQAEIYSGEIASYASQIENAVMRMQLINGCSDLEISFDHADWTGTDATQYLDANRHASLATPPADKSCHVLDPNGGGVDRRNIEKWLDTSKDGSATYRRYPYFTGHPWMGGIGITANPEPAYTDLIAVFSYVKKEICESINNKAGISTIPIFPQIALNEVFGQSNYGENATQWKDTGGLLTGKTFGCFQGQDHVASPGLLVDTYHVFQVLIAR